MLSVCLPVCMYVCLSLCLLYFFICLLISLFDLAASELTALCEDEYTTVIIAKSLLPYVARELLRLVDSGCTATETSTHFYLTTPLNGCSTATIKTLL